MELGCAGESRPGAWGGRSRQDWGARSRARSLRFQKVQDTRR